MFLSLCLRIDVLIMHYAFSYSAIPAARMSINLLTYLLTSLVCEIWCSQGFWVTVCCYLKL